MNVIKICRLFIVTCAVMMVSHAADFTDSSEVLTSDLGMRKLVPVDDVTDIDKGWIVTCRITDGKNVIAHRSCGFFKPEAAKKAFMMIINPKIFGSEFDGSIVTFLGAIYRLPKFEIGGETILKEGNDKKASLIVDEAGDTKVCYMVETVDKSELLTLSKERVPSDPNAELTMFVLKKPREVIINSRSQSK